VAVCGSVEAALAAATRGEPAARKDPVSVHEAADALRQAQIFLSDVAAPPGTDDEQRRLTRTLHALDHASRLAETAGGMDFATVRGGPDDARAGELCADAMRIATSVADDVARLPGVDPSPPASPAASDGKTLSTAQALAQLERFAAELEELKRTHRSATLGAVANGTLTADAAIVRVETLRGLQTLASHAWRSTLYLVGRDD
jgi:phosphate:Na+ symporter